ncbi:MAG: FKBP-type peptidyl-prolyl cis-trans isomerase [Gemmatimonadales bacterium]|nr:MAG: FKBP-type peptidyl-prolyl cis-trans isomerase [Gemmatimonadales bacterium]
MPATHPGSRGWHPRLPALLLPFLLLLASACGDPPELPEPSTTGSDPAAGEQVDLDRPLPDPEPVDLREAELAPSLQIPLEEMEEYDGGLLVLDRQVGGGREAVRGSEVTLHYTGWVADDGTRFDTTRESGEPFVVQLGLEPLVEGLERGIEGMREGGQRLLLIPPHLGHGEAGLGETIPPGAILHYEVELLEVQGGPGADPGP